MDTLQLPLSGCTQLARETDLGAHFPGRISEMIPPAPRTHSRATWEDCCFARWVITVLKMKWATIYVNRGDRIFYVLQKGPGVHLHTLCDIFQASIAFAYVPQQWRINRAIEHQSQSLLSPSTFILETPGGSPHKKGVLVGNPVHRKLHAYQSMKSIESTLDELVNKIEDSRPKRNHSVSIYTHRRSLWQQFVCCPQSWGSVHYM